MKNHISTHVTLKEVILATKDLSKGKSPGVESKLAEFYQQFYFAIY